MDMDSFHGTRYDCVVALLNFAAGPTPEQGVLGAARRLRVGLTGFQRSNCLLVRFARTRLATFLGACLCAGLYSREAFFQEMPIVGEGCPDPQIAHRDKTDAIH